MEISYSGDDTVFKFLCKNYDTSGPGFEDATQYVEARLHESNHVWWCNYGDEVWENSAYVPYRTRLEI